MPASRIRDAIASSWHTLSHVGVRPLETADTRSVVATNQFAFLASLGTLPYVVFFFSYDWPTFRQPAIAHLTLIGWWAFAIFLNSRRYHRSASIVALIFPVAEFANLTHFFSTDSGFHYYLFGGGLLSFSLFAAHQWMMRAFFIVVTTATFLYLEAYWSPPLNHHDYPDGVNTVFMIVNVCLTVVLLFLVARFNLHYYQRERDRNRELLVAAQTAAQTDALTDVYNRRGIAPVLSSVARRSDYALALVDLDRFKLINDRLGHGAGDVVLANAARTLVKSIGESGIVARWGGEEFLVVLPSVSLIEADEAMEKARADMEAEYGAPESLARVTISVGVAHAPRYAGKEEVLRLADSNLYEAKSSGRNVVVSARIDPQTLR